MFSGTLAAIHQHSAPHHILACTRAPLLTACGVVNADIVISSGYFAAILQHPALAPHYILACTRAPLVTACVVANAGILMSSCPSAAILQHSACAPHHILACTGKLRHEPCLQISQPYGRCNLVYCWSFHNVHGAQIT
jgi:hypothetical protein